MIHITKGTHKQQRIRIAQHNSNGQLHSARRRGSQRAPPPLAPSLRPREAAAGAMGRSKKARGGGSGRGGASRDNGSTAAPIAKAAAVPAATAPRVAPAPVPHADAWRLLLGQREALGLCLPVGLLLGVSRGMQVLIHDVTCAGSLRVRLDVATPSAGPAAAFKQALVTAGEAQATWLAKHARLLQSLHVDVWDEQEQYVAAGLRAAAGLADAPALSASARARSAVRIAQAAAAAFAADRALSAAASIPGLPALRELVVTGCDESGAWPAPPPSVARGLAACTGLMRLELVFAARHSPDAQANLSAQVRVSLPGALKAMQQLRELRLEIGSPPEDSEADAQRIHAAVPLLAVGVHAQDLSRQLTKLRLRAFGLSPAAACWPQLPAPLVEVDVDDVAVCSPAAHLTALRRLSCCSINASASLPASLTELRLAGRRVNACSQLPQQVAAVSALRSLTIADFRGDPVEQLTPHSLPAALESLDISIPGKHRQTPHFEYNRWQFNVLRWQYQDQGLQLLSQPWPDQPGVRRLPLTGLTLDLTRNPSWPPWMLPSIAHLGQWTGLTRLALTADACREYAYPCVAELPAQLAAQLRLVLHDAMLVQSF